MPSPVSRQRIRKPAKCSHPPGLQQSLPPAASRPVQPARGGKVEVVRWPLAGGDPGVGGADQEGDVLQGTDCPEKGVPDTISIWVLRRALMRMPVYVRFDWAPQLSRVGPLHGHCFRRDTAGGNVPGYDYLTRGQRGWLDISAVERYIITSIYHFVCW